MKKEQEGVSMGDSVPRKRKNPWLVVLIVLLSLLLLLGALVGVGYWWIHHTVDSNINTSDSYTDDEVDANDKDDIIEDIIEANPDVNPDEMEDKIANVQNIALFGIDQETGSVGRSDAMLILSIDKENGKINGHMASHQFLIDDFCTAVYENKLPYVNAWRAARFTIPGLVAHESAKLGGVPLDIPDFGDAPFEETPFEK